ncbi:unnamed protein product [Mytilus coruscus]|uniref:Integrase catalytic domain-containing protein n=1 Tax=Mytilus coruscus TaxID=42192 RepID=A0A6J8D979_MYTCO|nr:unnamed protein product [Mytilus coruscus]
MDLKDKLKPLTKVEDVKRITEFIKILPFGLKDRYQHITNLLNNTKDKEYSVTEIAGLIQTLQTILPRFQDNISDVSSKSAEEECSNYIKGGICNVGVVNIFRQLQNVVVAKEYDNEEDSTDCKTLKEKGPLIKCKTAGICASVYNCGIINGMKELYGSKLVVITSNRKIPLKILNMNDHECVIHKDAVTAFIEPIADIIESDMCNVIKIVTDNETGTRSKNCDLPEHIRPVFETSIKELNEQQIEFKNLLIKHKDSFSKSSADIGRTDLVEHTINTGDALPIRQRSRRIPLAKMEAAEIERMAKDGLIEPSTSPWNSPVVMIRNSDLSWRFCLDYRILNNITRKDVEQWCKCCNICASRKPPSKKPKAPLQQYNVGAPFERIGIDILGPLPKSTRGNKFLLVIGDYFTKWMEAIPIQDMEATTVANKLIERIVTIFGVPMEIHSDNGSNFESNVFAEMCKILGINKTKSTPLRPPSNWVVERGNRTIENMLSAFVSKNQKDWDDYISLLMMAYRSSEHQATEISPYEMVFGRQITLPVDMAMGVPSSNYEIPTYKTDYAYKLSGRINKIHEFA